MAVNRGNGSTPAQIGDRSSLDGTFPDDTVNDTRNTTDDSGVDNSDDNSVPATQGGGSTPATTSHGNGNPNGSDTTSSQPTTTTAATITTVFSGEGGSITVRLKDGVLSLVSSTTTAGYEMKIDHNGGDVGGIFGWWHHLPVALKLRAPGRPRRERPEATQHQPDGLDHPSSLTAPPGNHSTGARHGV